MSLKYIFCVGEDRINGYSDIYKFCHVPIDNIILKEIEKSDAPRLKCAWSRLDDYSEYLSFQEWFRESHDLPLDAEFKLWMSEPISAKKTAKKIELTHRQTMAKGSLIEPQNGETVGPYQRNRIVLCSADASPNSQRQQKGAAESFFPGAKWVGAVRNAAKRLDCKFTILTTKHGMINPTDEIEKYDLAINGNEETISDIWRNTIFRVLSDGQYDLLFFYAGGCPRDQYINILNPILQDLNIDLLTIGRPNMYDAGKIEKVVESLEKVTFIDELKKVNELTCPDKLLFYANKGYFTSQSSTLTPFMQIAKQRNLWNDVIKMKPIPSSSSVHGLHHWKSVFKNGLFIARETGASIELVELFSLFHDSCRLNDGKDPDHGKRAAEWVASMRSDLSNLQDDLFQYLLEAIRDHTHVQNTNNIHIATCWDADRLDLDRVRKTPKEEFMNTDIGRMNAKKKV